MRIDERGPADRIMEKYIILENMEKMSKTFPVTGAACQF